MNRSRVRVLGEKFPDFIYFKILLGARMFRDSYK